MSTWPTSDRNALSPRRALLHPLWLGALLVLALNDHALKGAGILPDVVTGKLSDFAGMIVAPLLLASVLGVRRRGSWVAAHVAVGVVFAAIQLSSAAAALWSGAMVGLGFPWAITSDVTDLLAVPVLWLSAHVFPRAMKGTASGHARRSVEYGVAGAGVLLCAATSPPPSEFPEPDLQTDVWLHNGTEGTVVVRVRPLRASVDLDCNFVETDPGRLLTEPLFGDVRSWTLEAGDNLSIRRGVDGQTEWGGWDPGFEELPDRECMVGLVDVDGVAPAIFFWRDGELDENTVPGRDWHPDISGGVRMQTGEDGQARFTDDEDGIVHTVVTALPPTTGACAPQSEGDRIAWGEVPVGLHRIESIDPGVDGCLALDLIDPGSEFETTTRLERWYLCVPEAVFPFQPLQDVSIDFIDTGASQGVRIAAQDQANAAELWVYAGGLAPATQGVTFTPIPDYGCELRADAACGTVARSSVIVAGGASYPATEIAAGQTKTLAAEDGSQALVFVAHAQERVALDAECAAGPDTIGQDLEVAIAFVAPAPE